MSVRWRFELTQRDKARCGRFSDEEDETIVRRVLEQHPDTLEDGMDKRVSWSVWEELGGQLNRKPRPVYQRWISGISHVLTRHTAGTGANYRLSHSLCYQFQEH